MPFRQTLCLVACLLAGSLSASAHLTYPAARDFGIFTSLTEQLVTITGQTTKIYGWADGTDSDLGHQDDQRYFKFTLSNPTTITVSITALDPATFFPAFSIYSGIGHAAADSSVPDYDGAAITLQYLASLGGTYEGAFNALHNFKIGNDAGTSFADLASFTYMGNKADGTSANFGAAPGINGDGVLDGKVTASFALPAGVYTMAVGGANYYNQTDNTAKGFNITVSSVPEPSSAVLIASGLAALSLLRRRTVTRARG